ncbi:DEKNAAC102448 [Brettanomyces naardenensis]|uniref:DEKNAAC102448 n=1 Tax=Brettanomyces naardenensis TaxID=13370 RepID=A0A448YL67_BRENA|nr:DEKNAAC102448 [Brettanomyces naardenensis]
MNSMRYLHRATSIPSAAILSLWVPCVRGSPYRLYRPLIATLSTTSSSQSQSSSPVVNYYGLFPNTFPNGAPPSSSFIINPRQLRKEYRKLQAVNHPDLISKLNKSGEDTDETVHLSSSLINKAYDTINDPLKRSQYLLKLNANIDLTSDEATHKYEFADQSTLMKILDIHESLENITNEEEVEKSKEENEQRIEQSVKALNDLYKEDADYDAIALETIRLKYWWNIKNALKEWQPGQPVNLTH